MHSPRRHRVQSPGSWVSQRSLSVSIGGVAFDGPASFSDLFRIADQRLYGAKQTGRNRVAVVHVSDHPFIELKRSA